MSNELKILELTKYYVSRYSLNTKYKSNSSENSNDGLGTYQQAITRILKEVQITQRRLWDVIKPDNGGTRKISIEDFEKHCFENWSSYIEANCTEYDHTRLADDKEKYYSIIDNNYWNKKAEEAIEAHNRAIENYDPNEDECSYSVSKGDVLEKGHNMMLEAIYNIFYESFNWGLLEYDMNNSILEDIGYNPPITGGTEKSLSNLKNYTNYIGRIKQHK